MSSTAITTAVRERAARRARAVEAARAALRRLWGVVTEPLGGRRAAGAVRARLRLVALAAALLLVAQLLVAPAAARAGTYAVESCTSGSTSGWAPFATGAYAEWGSSCGVWGGAMDAQIRGYAQSYAGWTFTAPADTEIAGFRLSRTFTLASGQPFGTSLVAAISGPSQRFYDWRPNFGGAFGLGPELLAANGLRGETTLTARLECGGGAACTGSSTLRIHGATIELRDDVPPVLASVSGSLLAAGPLKGTRTLTYTAHDKGGGVRREQLLVDGAVVAERGAECSSGLAVPCARDVSGTLAVDTARLADGEHEATLVVTDVAGGWVTHGPVRFTVDNVPPPRSTSPPRISGTTTFVADDGGWVGANLVLTRRWQRLESGSWQDIAGAEAPVYTPGAEDAGHRLRFRVRASNAEGAVEAFSEPTARLPELPVATPTPTPSAPTNPSTPSRLPAAAPSPPDAAAAARLTAAFAATGRSVVTVRWGERRKVTGTLTRGDGRPLGGERVAVTSTLRATGAVSVGLGHVVTDGAGRFSFLPPAGASRSLRFTRGDSAATVTVHVVPRITVRLTRPGRIAGRVLGAPPGLAKRVQLQALRGRVWRTFASTRLKPVGGRFGLRPRTLPRRVRVRVAAEPGWPFVTGTSAAVGR